MIREIKGSDLCDSYFELLCQLSGDLKPYNVYNIWKAYLNGSSKTYVYLNKDNTIIGSATVFIEAKFLHCGSRVGHIEDVVVDETCRTKGVGTSLIDVCLEYSKVQGCYKVILDCAEHNIPFYAKCGFIPDGYCLRHNLDKENQ